MAQIRISAGKVPATVKELTVEEGITVEEAMQIASEQCGFSFSTKSYKSGSREMVDVPFLNGTELCRRDGDKIVEVFWKTPVSDGDIILIVPRIKGN